MRTVAELPDETRTDLPVGARTQVAGLMNQLLADAIDLGAQAKQAHWNVSGSDFHSLPVLFDAIYCAVDVYVDLIAERVVQLGGIAGGTVRMVAHRSDLAEYPTDVDAGLDNVSAIAAVLAQFGGHTRRGIRQAIEWGDQDGADICAEVSRGIDRWLWMVEAHRQASPGVTARSATTPRAASMSVV